MGKLRRAPKPVTLPSMRAENSGLDPNVALVPPGGNGWGKGLLASSSPTPPVEPAAPEETQLPSAAPRGWSRSSLESPQKPVNVDKAFPELGADESSAARKLTHDVKKTREQRVKEGREGKKKD